MLPAAAGVASPDWMPACRERAPLSFRLVTMKVLSSVGRRDYGTATNTSVPSW
jgi:hypothetical protein